MFFVIFALQNMYPYSPLKLLGYIVLGLAIYSGTIEVLKTFSREGLDFIMLLIPGWRQNVRVVVSVLFL